MELGGKAHLGVAHVLVKLALAVAWVQYTRAGTCRVAASGHELDGLGRRVLFARTGFLRVRGINLVLAVVVFCVFDVAIVHVMGKRRLVLHRAGRRGWRGHQQVARVFAVLGLKPVLGQEILVLKPGVGRDHVGRSVLVLANLHQTRMQDVLLLVVVALVVQRGVAEVRLVWRRGLAIGPKVAGRAFRLLRLRQLAGGLAGSPILGMGDGLLHLLGHGGVALDIGHHVRALGRRLVAVVID